MAEAAPPFECISQLMLSTCKTACFSHASPLCEVIVKYMKASHGIFP